MKITDGVLLDCIYGRRSCVLRKAGLAVIEQGSELRSLPTRRATGLPLRPQAPYFDHEKMSDDRVEPGEQDEIRKKAISECREDRFELRLDSSR